MDSTLFVLCTYIARYVFAKRHDSWCSCCFAPLNKVTLTISYTV